MLTVTELAPSCFRVDTGTTTHEVEIPSKFVEKLGIEVDGDTLIRETFAFLLEREPASSIMVTFSLDVVSRFFPEYLDELRARLAER